jgi:hypothetical protein
MINEADRCGGGQRLEVGFTTDPPEAPKQRTRTEPFSALEKDLQPPGQLPEEGFLHRREASALPLYSDYLPVAAAAPAAALRADRDAFHVPLAQ